MVLPRFLAELKHRKVYRAAVVYAAVGWALLEMADVVLPRLALPDWTVNLVLALVLLGFPLAIVIAWIFDLSPQGIVRTEPLAPVGRQHRFSIAAIVEFVLIVALVIAVGGLYVDRLSMQKELAEAKSATDRSPNADQLVTPNPEQFRAIAVLPFADMSETGDQAWFAEGIAEELLHALAGVEGLQVMARTSSFAFKGTDKTIAQIADILGVQAVLEGSVRRSGDRVRITAQLADASSGYHLWSGSYERQIKDIFQLQDELAKSVVEALRIELGVTPSMPLVAEQTRIPEAYNWFMRGRALLDWANPTTSGNSIGYLEKAVEADPDYALAWGYLAYARSLNILWRPFDEVNPLATVAYERALALDPEQSEALAAKALMTLMLEHDWEAAGNLYQRAMELQENIAAITGYAAFYLIPIDRIPQAIRLYARAEDRDPLQAGYKANLANFLAFNGDIDGAILKAQEALELNPQHLFAFIALIDAYTLKRDYSAIQTVMQNIPPELQQRPTIKARAGLYYAATGDHEKARLIYRDLVDTPPIVPVMRVSELALALGEVEEAIDLMELNVEKHSWTQHWIRFRFRDNDSVNSHPRYRALLKRIGLDDESVAALNKRLSFE
jgi:TolB-like protein/Tfp pilus assembly protein PilF